MQVYIRYDAPMRLHTIYSRASGDIKARFWQRRDAIRFAVGEGWVIVSDRARPLPMDGQDFHHFNEE